MPIRQVLLATSMAAILSFSAPAMAEKAGTAFDPYDQYPAEVSENGMVVVQEGLAAEVGRQILAKGGNAVDAAVATGFAMAVTHPQAGNIGGGGFMVIWLAEEKRAVAIDFREMAPAGADRDMYLNEEGDADFDLSQYSHLSSGVPGSVMGLTYALETYGTMSLREVIAPAIRLAARGIPVSYGLEAALHDNKASLSADPSTVAYFLTDKDGGQMDEGDLLVQKDLARTLREISRKGAKGFYEGWVADAIVEEMARGGGLITHEDLANYKVVEREPVRGTYRGHEIIGMPPPSSGGIHVIQMLNILEGYNNLGELGHNSAAYLHRVIEAMRRAFADRSKYVGDPDYFDVPTNDLINKAYAYQLRQNINLEQATPS